MKKLIVEGIGDHPIRFLRVLRTITRFGLRDAKALRDSLPGMLLDGLLDDQARGIADQFRVIGATIRIEPTETDTVMIRLARRLKT